MKHTFAAEFRATLGGSRQIRRRIAEKATFEFPVAQEKMGAMRRTKRTKLNISQAGTQLLATFLSLAACGTFVQAPSQSAAPSLGGTSWQLVKFQGSDDKTMTPDDKAKYTIQFSTDGGLSARIDCNRGRGTWKSPEPGQLQLAPLALTRACAHPDRCTI